MVLKKKKKVLIALSGGIDSAVSAYLLIKEGYYVEAAFMKNWSSTKGLLKNECPWLEDRRDALRVAAFLGIKLHTLDFEKQYQKNVMNYFFKEYKAGRTPNPDVMCNKEIKFKLLYNWAMKKAFDFLATGHYARSEATKHRSVRQRRTATGALMEYKLLRSKDECKDQTYFIYNIKQEQLAHLLFPIGGMKKTAVKKLAEKIGLPNVGRKESMGLCFVGKIRLKEFLGQKIKAKPGKIVFIPSMLFRVQPKQSQPGKRLPRSSAKADSLAITTHRILGQHEGLQNYTIGQRQGIKIGPGGPFFVYKKDLKTNTLYVTNNPEDKRLFVREIQLHSVNWINFHLRFKIEDLRLEGRYRHQGILVPLSIKKIKKDPSRSRRAEADLYQVKFKKPQKAVASGQSLVLYKGKECVGGGVIV